MYYRCTGHRGKCPEPYTRQETIVDAFASTLSELVIPEAVLDWLADAVTSTDGRKRQRARQHANAWMVNANAWSVAWPPSTRTASTTDNLRRENEDPAATTPRG